MSDDGPAWPSRDKLNAVRGYGFERVPHLDDVAKLFAVYTHLVKTCGLTSATLNKWMLEGYLKLGANIKAEINKTTEAHQKIPADLVAWFNEQEYIWDRTDSNKQAAALLRHPNVEVKFNSFLKPQDKEKINDEIKELVESFRALTPNEPSFDVMEEIERRAKKSGCYEVEIGVPKERGESSSA
ncbi:hypothetical protein CMUS01_09580 [Colletotrichum musicola]|uniref:Uncharacterized protein n=1 Tax=Colletotrichum musicola TaxID=2175873 RepID=A0A8H6K792_9PEZI|nr:hypothetical protein CMUS01_09580 [Colletotrichum musicola]